MSVVTTTTRLAAMWRKIEGVQKVFDTVPRVVQDAELPAVVILPGEGTYDLDSAGDNEVIERRLYRMTILIYRAEYGTEGRAQDKVEPFFDRARDYFLSRPGLELEGATNPQTVVYNTQLTGDSGFLLIPYPGGNESPFYGGIEFRLQVQEWASIVYHDGG